MSNTLAEQFHAAMSQVYPETVRRTHRVYKPTRFRQGVNAYGGVAYAKRLMAAPQPQEGFARLWELKCIDLSAEFLIVQEKFQPLFTATEIQVARKRLEDLL